MTEVRTMGRELQDEVLKTVRQSQTAVIEAIRTWTSTVESITPKLPELNMPFTDTMPKPYEFIANAYDFAEQLLASQRRFAEEILKTMTPLQLGTGSTPKAAAGK
jgi:hypothetical protein